MPEWQGNTDLYGRPLFTMRADLFEIYLDRLEAAADDDDGQAVYEIVLELREELEAAA